MHAQPDPCNCFFWPQIATQVKEHVDKCCQCITFKGEANSGLPWKILWPPIPRRLVHIDYLHLDPGKGREENVLVVMDHFT